jgi:hypothetical protein
MVLLDTVHFLRRAGDCRILRGVDEVAACTRLLRAFMTTEPANPKPDAPKPLGAETYALSETLIEAKIQRSGAEAYRAKAAEMLEKNRVALDSLEGQENEMVTALRTFGGYMARTISLYDGYLTTLAE